MDTLCMRIVTVPQIGQIITNNWIEIRECIYWNDTALVMQCDYPRAIHSILAFICVDYWMILFSWLLWVLPQTHGEDKIRTFTEALSLNLRWVLRWHILPTIFRKVKSADDHFQSLYWKARKKSHTVESRSNGSQGTNCFLRLCRIPVLPFWLFLIVVEQRITEELIKEDRAHLITSECWRSNDFIFRPVFSLFS